MTIRRISTVILAIAVLASLHAAVASADSVQWGESENSSTSARDLRWSQPKVASKASKVVSAQHVVSAEGDSSSSIRQVQHTTPPFAPPAPPSSGAITPAQRDLVYPELRPQNTGTPPSGATLLPSSPTVSTPSFSSGSSAASTPSSSFSNGSAAGKSVSKPKNDAVSNNFARPESKSTELKNPALQNTESLTPAASGGARAPQPLDRFSPEGISSRNREIECPGQASTKSIRDISYDIRPMPGTLPKECPLAATNYTGRHFSQTCFQWKASALCTKGAYFEDVQLERYGHSVCPLLQPVISGAKFFVTVPFLPYKMGLQTPDECVYTLGHYRPGNCAPYMLDPLPISIRAILFEGAAIGGAVALIP